MNSNVHRVVSGHKKLGYLIQLLIQGLGELFKVQTLNRPFRHPILHQARGILGHEIAQFDLTRQGLFSLIDASAQRFMHPPVQLLACR